MKKILLLCLTLFLLAGCNGQSSVRSASDAAESAAQISAGELQVHYIDVGQGDATLLQYADQSSTYRILLDAGNINSDNLIPYLKAQQVDYLDVAIGTHPDADHIGQLAKVLQTFSVGEIWLSGNTSTSDTFQELLHVISETEIEYAEPRRGNIFDIGPMEIEVLSPKNISGQSNEESLAFRFTYGDIHLLFTGDAPVEMEQEMIEEQQPLAATILHLGHHGSSTSTSPAFLEAVDPEMAIYSAGKNNTYGHPHQEVVDLVKSKGIPLYGTDTDGTIVVESDGISYHIHTTNQQACSGIDLNRASLEELQEIVHIGEARAAELISLRPFHSLNELKKISGIGERNILDIKEQGTACVDSEGE
ncbi:MBL fold metallo-hydrolase [Bacillaceae bacterium Marseille-Q3522]|nr:MBL fold metallo-hydrolase [Bacillaceae bacterium Marseille-Q3522]